jgi:colicin import membrane protein
VRREEQITALRGREADLARGIDETRQRLDVLRGETARVEDHLVVATQALAETEKRQQEVATLLENTRRGHEGLVARATEEARRLKDERAALELQITDLRREAQQQADEAGGRIKRLAEQSGALEQRCGELRVELDELITRGEGARRELADLDAQTAEAREASELAMAQSRKAREALVQARKELSDHELLSRETQRRLEAAEQKRRTEIEERLELEARTRNARLAAEDQLRTAKERHANAQKAHAEATERINKEREESQARVKQAGDMMAAALAAQRQLSDKAIEDRRKAQGELDDSARQLEESERASRDVFEGIRRAQAAQKDAGAGGEVEIPDSM